MRWLGETIGALWVLMTLLVASKGRVGGAYWRWRMQTAFPGGVHPGGLMGALREGMGYARWAWRIRRLR